MKVSQIFDILDMTWSIKQNNGKFIPNFEGPAGIGKSQVMFQWAERMKAKYPDFRVIDRRVATMDSADLQGLPFGNSESQQTDFLPPDFLPKSGHGLLILDEVTRGKTEMQNCLMQLFTDYQVGNYHLPKGWIIATSNNPSDSEAYNTESKDAAFDDRIRTFKMKFDHKGFVEHAKLLNWPQHMVSYLSSGQWVYKEPGTIDFYISPRGWGDLAMAETLSDVLKNSSMHFEVCLSILGKNIGNDYWNYVHKTKPVTYSDLLSDYKAAKMKPESIATLPTMVTLASYAQPQKSGARRDDLISATFQSFVAVGKDIEPHLLMACADAFPADQSLALVHELSFSFADPVQTLRDWHKQFPATFKRLRSLTKKDDDAKSINK